jgi:hypothetical protein
MLIEAAESLLSPYTSVYNIPSILLAPVDMSILLFGSKNIDFCACRMFPVSSTLCFAGTILFLLLNAMELLRGTLHAGNVVTDKMSDEI